MKHIITILFFILSFFVKAQGVLHSYVKQDTIQPCTLTVRNIDNWENPKNYVFKVATITILQSGDYMVSYMVNGLYIHSEWIHIGKYRTVIDKVILTKPLKLTDVTFIRPKNTFVYREQFYLIKKD